MWCPHTPTAQRGRRQTANTAGPHHTHIQGMWIQSHTCLAKKPMPGKERTEMTAMHQHHLHHFIRCTMWPRLNPTKGLGCSTSLPGPPRQCMGMQDAVGRRPPPRLLICGSQLPEPPYLPTSPSPPGYIQDAHARDKGCRLHAHCHQGAIEPACRGAGHPLLSCVKREESQTEKRAHRSPTVLA